MTSSGVTKSRDMEKRRNLFGDVSTRWNGWLYLTALLGTILVAVFARNTVGWYFQRIWQFSGDYCQHQWGRVYDMLDGDQTKMAFTGTFVVSTVTFFGVNLFLSILDLTGIPHALVKYKIQADKNNPVDRALFAKALGWVIFNQMIVAPPVFYLSYVAMTWRGCDFGRQLPTFPSVMFELFICVVMEEIFFYYSHRLFHIRFLYKHIHKMHHEWTAPIGITALYAHPLEHIVCNMLPAIIGPLVLGCHVTIAWLWFATALMSTTVAHCGYHFPLVYSPEFHDYHHLKFVNNFGVVGFLDWFHGTDAQFRGSIAYKRHMITFNLTPVSLIFPEKKLSSDDKITKQT